MISDRYGSGVTLLLALAMVPTIIHSYLEAKSEDGYSARSINFELADLKFLDTTRRDEWVRNMFSAEDWIERTAQGPGGSKIRLFVGRSFDPKRLYHHPELALLYSKDMNNKGVQSIKAMGDVPVHLLQRRNNTGVAAYCLLYGEEFVDNPILFQILTSLKLLVSARKPMTLFFVYDEGLSSTQAIEESEAIRVLQATVRDFRSQIPSNSSAVR